MIQTPTLITALSAHLNGKKTLAIINGDRESVGVTFDKNASVLIVEFDNEIDFIHATIHVDKFSSQIKVKGLGFDNKDIRPILPLKEKHTYRFNLPQRAKGTLEISTKGGSGTAILYNLSGFRSE